MTAKLLLLAVALNTGVASAQVLNPGDVLTRMEQRSARQNEQLQWTQHLRSYEAENTRMHKKGELLARVRYDAPDQKAITVINRNGSGSIQGRVFDPLIKAEKESADPKVRATTEICRRNYEFTFDRFDVAESAYVFRMAPRTENRYLVRGEIWVDAHEFAVRRIEGEPAQKPSFWVRKTHFVHEYRKFGDYWFPVSNRTEVELKLLGNSKLTIEYKNYEWEGKSATPAAVETIASF